MAKFFATLPRTKFQATYAETVAMARPGGCLSIGFVWALAEHDEVFAAYLRKVGLEKP